MKKKSSSALTMILLLGFGLLVGEKAVSQTKSLSPADMVQLSSRLKVLAGQDITLSDELPVAKMLSEPNYTSGLNNRIFWESLPDSFDYQGKRIPTDTLRVVASWKTNSIDSIDAGPYKPINPDSNFYDFKKVPWPDSTVYYLIQFWLPGSGVFSKPDSLVYSKPDIAPPELASLEVQPSKAWFGKNDTIIVSFDGLADSAGIEKAFLQSSSGLSSKISFVNPDTMQGQRGPASVSAQFSLLANSLASGPNTLLSGACDAAYDAVAHGPSADSKIAANWTINGNCGDFPSKLVVKVDLVTPVWDLSSVEERYTEKDLSEDGKIWISAAANDSLSGIDANLLTVSIDDSTKIRVTDITITGGGADGAGAEVQFALSGIPPQGIDTTITLKFHAVDRAGNASDTTKSVSLQIEPASFRFALVDTSTGADSAQIGYTNDTVIGWRTLEKSFKDEDIGRIVFYGTVDSVVWAPLADSLLNLTKLFGSLESGSSYEVSAKVVLKSGIRSKPDSLPSASITYDDEKPTKPDANIVDLGPSPLPAADGFTDSTVVRASITSKDAVRMEIKGDVISVIVDGSEIIAPAVVEFQQDVQLKLQVNGDPAKDIVITTWDRAGNESDSLQANITYVYQNIVVAIPGPQPQKVSEINIVDTIQVSITCPHPEYLWLAKTKTHTDTLDGETNLKSCTKEGDLFHCTLAVPFFVDSSKFDYVVISDSAGHQSIPVTVHFEVILPPEISLALYDYSEFDSTSIETSDSSYTDELKIWAVVTLKEGSWSNVFLAFEKDTFKDSGVATAGPRKIFQAPLDTLDFDCDIRMKAQAINSKGDTSSTVFSAIRYDVTKPVLNTFDAAVDADGKGLDFSYTDFDGEDCSGGVAGIVLKDSVSANEQKWFYFPKGAENKLTPLNISGIHNLVAFVVDSADVDQNVKKLSGTAEDALYPLGEIDHSSTSKKFPYIWQPILANKAYNYPNPFNPERESTRFYIPPLSTGTIEVRIFDLFGNLVWEKTDGRISSGASFGNLSTLLEWSGRNGRNEIVASGTYIAIIKPKNGKAFNPIKVGILRKD